MTASSGRSVGERARSAWEMICKKRKQLDEAAYGRYDARGHDRISTADSIVHHAARTAEAMGLSGEDRYVLMASLLLDHANKMEKLVLDDELLRPMKMFLPFPDEPK